MPINISKVFLRKTKIRHYIHRYSSVDPNEQRLLVFTEGKDNKRLAGIIFKCSEKIFARTAQTDA